MAATLATLLLGERSLNSCIYTWSVLFEFHFGKKNSLCGELNRDQKFHNPCTQPCSLFRLQPMHSALLSLYTTTHALSPALSLYYNPCTQPCSLFILQPMHSALLSLYTTTHALSPALSLDYIPCTQPCSLFILQAMHSALLSLYTTGHALSPALSLYYKPCTQPCSLYILQAMHSALLSHLIGLCTPLDEYSIRNSA